MTTQDFDKLIRAKYEAFLEAARQNILFDTNQELHKKELLEKGFYTLDDTDLPNNQKIFPVFHTNYFLSNKPHKHNFFEFLYVYDGKVQIEESGKTIELNQGDICLFNIHVIHQVFPISPDTVAVNLIVKQSYMSDIRAYLYHTQDIVFSYFCRCLFQDYQTPMHLYFSKDELFPLGTLDVFNQLYVECTTGQPMYEEAADLLFKLFCILLTRSCQSRADSLTMQTKTGVPLSDVLNYMNTHCSTVTLQNTADYFHYHPKHLSRILKQQTGHTFMETLNALRVMRACQLLTKDQTDISEICNQIGYQNQSSFYRMFKMQTGKTPEQFRKEHNSIATICNNTTQTHLI